MKRALRTCRTVMRPSRVHLVGAMLIGVVVGAYAGVIHNGFVFDDAVVFSSHWMREGLSLAGVRWSLTAQAGGNWHPLTLLSHMLDVQFFGMNPGAHHLISVALHAANAVLLFSVLRAMTGDLWRGAVVAALFAIHPLHVESVAWVAERKDVLSTLFGLLAIAAYCRYVRRPGAVRYVLVLVSYAASLASKPMLVTLPFLLLLLDFWPLNRGTGGGESWRRKRPCWRPRLARAPSPS
ncbi:MAG TPA: hypothetical protein VI078_17080 [bacterium]